MILSLTCLAEINPLDDDEDEDEVSPYGEEEKEELVDSNNISPSSSMYPCAN